MGTIYDQKTSKKHSCKHLKYSLQSSDIQLSWTPLLRAELKTEEILSCQYENTEWHTALHLNWVGLLYSSKFPGVDQSPRSEQDLSMQPFPQLPQEESGAQAGSGLMHTAARPHTTDLWKQRLSRRALTPKEGWSCCL